MKPDGVSDWTPAYEVDTKLVLKDILNFINNKDLKVLIYNGVNDYTVNYMGLEKVIQNIEWYGQTDFAENN